MDVDDSVGVHLRTQRGNQRFLCQRNSNSQGMAAALSIAGRGCARQNAGVGAREPQVGPQNAGVQAWEAFLTEIRLTQS